DLIAVDGQVALPGEGTGVAEEDGRRVRLSERVVYRERGGVVEAVGVGDVETRGRRLHVGTQVDAGIDLSGGLRRGLGGRQQQVRQAAGVELRAFRVL